MRNAPRARLIVVMSMAAAAILSACDRAPTSDGKSYPSQAVGERLDANLAGTCVSDHRPGVDYFPDKVRFEHSDQLAVEYGPNFKRLTFRSGVQNGDDLEFLLVQCGTPTPANVGSATVIEVPVRRIATATLSMLGAADDLGVADRIVAVASTRGVTVPSIRARIDAGLVQEASGYMHGNIEPIMAVDPDVYLTFYSGYPQYNIHPRLLGLGVKALPHADRVERTPLGRAEWIKFTALLTNTEGRANDVFGAIARDYQRLSEAVLAEAPSERPVVMAGFASARSVFETFGGANERARLVRDAGGRHVLSDDRFVGSWLVTGFERVYAAGGEAPVWLGAAAGTRDVASLVAANPLNGWFRAVRERNVTALDQGYRGLFAYHLEDQSMARPHILLAETIEAIHPRARANRIFAAAAGLRPDSPFFARRLP